MKTSLSDYTLWYDGSVEADPSSLESLILAGVPLDVLSVTRISPEVISLNKQTDHKLDLKTSLQPIQATWLIPEAYKYLDVEKYLESLSERIERDELYQKRISRLILEIQLFKKNNLDNVVRTLVYVIDTFEQKQLVWGVGRGSSCSSYILYLMGLHEVDPVKYDISIYDFIK